MKSAQHMVNRMVIMTFMAASENFYPQTGLLAGRWEGYYTTSTAGDFRFSFSEDMLRNLLANAHFSQEVDATLPKDSDEMWACKGTLGITYDADGKSGRFSKQYRRYSTKTFQQVLLDARTTS